MSVICGTDFSEPSRRAADVAAELAARLEVPLELIHAMPDWPSDATDDEKAAIRKTVERSLERHATQLREQKRVEVKTRAELEPALTALRSAAEKHAAKLLVVGATGRGGQRGRSVGSTADRLAQQSQVPTLVIRQPSTFERWLRGERPLRVMVGLDFNQVSDGAWRWATQLAAMGPVELIGTYVYWPPAEFARIGLSGLRPYLEPNPDVERVLMRELQARFPHGAPGPSVQFRAVPSIGRPSDHLLRLAAEEHADLIVVGSHARSAVERLWEGSVSRLVLHDAGISVACVPQSAHPATRPTDEITRVLVATDFSPTGNAALSHAYAQVGRGGKVFLMHVLEGERYPTSYEPHDILTVSPEHEKDKQAALETLRGLIPLRSSVEDKVTEVLVAQSRRPGEAIAQVADRVGAQLICVGTRGRGGIAKAVLGSVAQEVLERTQVPLLLIKKPKA
jgi:nucleotide-binding universal stress UspA family protein